MEVGFFRLWLVFFGLHSFVLLIVVCIVLGFHFLTVFQNYLMIVTFLTFPFLNVNFFH